MVVTEAPAAYAAARCLAARVRDRSRWLTTDHPSRCGWCDLPTDVLDGMVRHFNDLVEFDVRNSTSTSGAVTFGRLERDEQLRQIVAAQALEDEPPPAPGRPVDSILVASGPAAVASEPAARPEAPPVGTRPTWAGGRS